MTPRTLASDLRRLVDLMRADLAALEQKLGEAENDIPVIQIEE